VLCVATMLSFALTWWFTKRNFLAAADSSGTKSWPLATAVSIIMFVLQMEGVMFLSQWVFKNTDDVFAKSYFFVWSIPTLVIVLSNSARYGNKKKNK
jgi:hypothetical protein